MYCSREYQASARLIQQYEKSTLNDISCFYYSDKNVKTNLHKGKKAIAQSTHFFFDASGLISCHRDLKSWSKLEVF